jgi:hypothetical protein
MTSGIFIHPAHEVTERPRLVQLADFRHRRVRDRTTRLEELLKKASWTR